MDGIDVNKWGELPQREQSKKIKTSGPIIKMEDEDIQEIQEHQLKMVQEEGQRESSDEGDDDEFDGNQDVDDPDNDLDF